jgi:hypothetical protein
MSEGQKPSIAEQKFIESFRRTGNAGVAVVQSGIRDGRSPDKIAEDLLGRSYIRAAIESAEPFVAPSIELDKETVLADIYNVKDRAMEEGRYSEVINSLKLISDLQGLRTTKVEVTHNKSIKDMTDDELVAIVEKAGRKDLLG